MAYKFLECHQEQQEQQQQYQPLPYLHFCEIKKNFFFFFFFFFFNFTNVNNELCSINYRVCCDVSQQTKKLIMTFPFDLIDDFVARKKPIIIQVIEVMKNVKKELC